MCPEGHATIIVLQCFAGSKLIVVIAGTDDNAGHCLRIRIPIGH